MNHRIQRIPVAFVLLVCLWAAVPGKAQQDGKYRLTETGATGDVYDDEDVFGMSAALTVSQQVNGVDIPPIQIGYREHKRYRENVLASTPHGPTAVRQA